VAEAVLAVFSVYIWYFSRPGALHSLAFYLMAVSFVSTVLFNANPLMKFDGYFILSDYLGIPNLQSKSFAFLRYLFMRRVLGIETVQNPDYEERELTILGVYGVSALAYRFVLYAGIVTGVYYRFDKVVGLMLAVLAFAVFVVRPLYRGTKVILTNRSAIHLQSRGAAVLALSILAVLALLLVPLSTKSVYPCHVASAQIQKLTVPLQTSVATVNVREGTSVSQGSVLYELHTPVLQLDLLKKEVQRDVLRSQIETMLLDSKQRAQVGAKRIELYHAEREVRRVEKELLLAREGTAAPFDGVVTRLDPLMQPGFQPGEGAVVGELQSTANCVIHRSEERRVGKECRSRWSPYH